MKYSQALQEAFTPDKLSNSGVGIGDKFLLKSFPATDFSGID